MGSSKRRYKVSLFPVYSDTFDRLRMDSVVLNAGARHTSISHNGDLNDKSYVTWLLLLLVGNEDGENAGYYRNGETGNWIQSKLPVLENQMKQIEDQWADLKQRKINEGQYPPDRMPKNLFTEKLKLEAEIDVVTEEVEYLNKLLSEWKEEQVEEDNRKMLYQGPMGGGSLHDGILIEIDGQKVSLYKGRLLVIDCEKSPYHGMASADYIASVVKPWKVAKSKLEHAEDDFKYRLFKRQGIRYDSSEMKTELKKFRKDFFLKNPDLKPLFKIKLDGKPAMPSWPKGVKKHLKNENEK